MTRTTTHCPTCFKGHRYETCRSCDGKGEVRELDLETCRRCEGAGEVEMEGTCPTCGGAGEIRWGLMRIMERGRRDGPAVAPLPYDPEVGQVPDDGVFGRPIHVLEQLHHGATSAALAAWADVRDRIRPMSRIRVRAAQVTVPDANGDRALLQHAIVVETIEMAIYLTGCSWGYGGEGPNGTAAILDDLEFFPDYETALEWVAAQRWAPPPADGPAAPDGWKLVGIGPAR